MNLRPSVPAIAYTRLGFAESKALSNHQFHLLVIADRGVQVDVPADWVSAWIVLRGSLSLHSGRFGGDVARGRLLTWQDGPLRLLSYAPAGCIGIAAPAALWQRMMSGEQRDAEHLLYPWQCPAGRDVQRLLLRVARLVRHGKTRNHAALGALVTSLTEHQAPIHRYLDACSGRTRQRREQVLARLMRVRNLITHGRERRFELTELADVANYSPTHLIRLFRDVFGETPADYAMRLRVERSWSLVRDTHMPIGDISERVGFESKSAFCRSFKTTFGKTTSEVRRRHCG